jgi:hypothetical protein
MKRQHNAISHRDIEFIKYETFYKTNNFLLLAIYSIFCVVFIVETYVITGHCEFNRLNDDKRVWTGDNSLMSEYEGN